MGFSGQASLELTGCGASCVKLRPAQHKTRGVRKVVAAALFITLPERAPRVGSIRGVIGHFVGPSRRPKGPPATNNWRLTPSRARRLGLGDGLLTWVRLVPGQ